MFALSEIENKIKNKIKDQFSNDPRMIDLEAIDNKIIEKEKLLKEAEENSNNKEYTKILVEIFALSDHYHFVLKNILKN